MLWLTLRQGQSEPSAGSDRDKPPRGDTMIESLEERFQNLHEFVTQARTNLEGSVGGGDHSGK